MNQTNSNWYKSLNQSPITPPSWVFPIAWTILYVLIIASGVVFLTNGGPVRSVGFLYYCAAWVLNLSWSQIFFTYQRPDLSLIVIVFMSISIAYTIYEFSMVSRTASYLLVPYLVWVIFATNLNSYIVGCNKQYSMNFLPSFLVKGWICK